MKLKCYALFFRHLRSYKSLGTLHKPHHFVSVERAFSNWHIVGALCLERKPVITQLMTPLEKSYFQYLQKLEVEKSLLSDHEKKQIEDKRQAEKLEAGNIEDLDVISKQTAQDFEDASLEEFNKFRPHSRTTESDMNDDRHSVERKLDSSLTFVVRQKIGNDDRWVLPQAVHQDGETLRQTAERALDELCSNQVKVQFLGCAPVGYYKYKYPKAVRGNGICGAKVFFFKAQLLENKSRSLNLKQTNSVSDYLWLTHAELADYLQPVYNKTIQSFLLPDVFNVESSYTTSHYFSSDDDEQALMSSAVSQA